MGREVVGGRVLLKPESQTAPPNHQPTDNDDNPSRPQTRTDTRRWGGVTLYQTDWSLAAVTLRVPGSSVSQIAPSPLDDSPAGQVAPGQPISLPLASLAGKGGTPENAKIWATFLPIEAIPQDGRPPKGISSAWLRGGTGGSGLGSGVGEVLG